MTSKNSSAKASVKIHQPKLPLRLSLLTELFLIARPVVVGRHPCRLLKLA